MRNPKTFNPSPPCYTVYGLTLVTMVTTVSATELCHTLKGYTSNVVFLMVVIKFITYLMTEVENTMLSVRLKSFFYANAFSLKESKNVISHTTLMSFSIKRAGTAEVCSHCYSANNNNQTRSRVLF